MEVVMESVQLVTFVNSVVIPICLFLIMMGMGLTLVVNDFKRVVKFPKAVSIGLANQLIMLPLIGFALANIMPLRPEYAVGVMLLVLCPGGTTSNLFTFLAKGDVALSVTMTAIASVITVFSIPVVLSFSLIYCFVVFFLRLPRAATRAPRARARFFFCFPRMGRFK